MALDRPVNLNGLNIVRTELEASLQQAAGEFEAYLLDRDGQPGALEQCHRGMQQAAGCLRLIEFPDAALFADEMASAIAGLGDSAFSEPLLEAIGQGFLVLPRYLEFVGARQRALPLLMVPFINEIRIARRLQLLPEYHFESFDPATPSAFSAPAQAPSHSSRQAARMRHMYQVGLLGILRGQSDETSSMLLARAAKCIASLDSQSGGGLFVALAGACEALAAGRLVVTPGRTRLLARAEQLIARWMRNGADGLAHEPTAACRRELLFLVALSGHAEGKSGEAARLWQLPDLEPGDSALEQHRAALRGPGRDALDSVVRALRDEMRRAREMLEIAAQQQRPGDVELEPLERLVMQVADTLVLLDLERPARGLRHCLEEMIANSQGAGQGPQQALADEILFVESCLGLLLRDSSAMRNLDTDDSQVRRQVIASSHRAEAEDLVISEVLASIAMAKRAINAYIESSFDRAHISNLATSLATVRGALHLLGYARCAAVVASAAAFIRAHLDNRPRREVQHQPMLETFADALISIEHYLMELAADRRADERTLEIAEESLGALGFRVEPGA